MPAQRNCFPVTNRRPQRSAKAPWHKPKGDVPAPWRTRLRAGSRCMQQQLSAKARDGNGKKNSAKSAQIFHTVIVSRATESPANS